jgi:hypothetical protein
VQFLIENIYKKNSNGGQYLASDEGSWGGGAWIGHVSVKA